MANYIPEEVTVNILRRLPIKSLIRFAGVSKQWRFIILFDPQFPRTHLNYSKQQTPNPRLLISTRIISEFESREFESLSSFKDKSSMRKFSFPVKGDIMIMSSCNGLVFSVSYMERQIDTNPSTRFFFKSLPPVSPKERCLLLHGFGYVSSTDEYKFVAKFGEVGSLTTEKTNFHIFSSKANIWKFIDNPLFPNSRCEEAAVLVNEALHWINHEDQVITAIDLAREELCTMPLPNGDGRHLYYFSYIGVVESGLFVCNEANIISGYVDLWVMRDYRVAESWNKVVYLEGLRSA